MAGDSKIYCTALKEKSLRPVCLQCNINLCRKRYRHGEFKTFETLCGSCIEKRTTGLTVTSRWKYDKKYAYLKFKKASCEECSFIPKHECQLDVDHVDGDHSNNVPENLQTLCANCHRLKSFQNKDNMAKLYKFKAK